MNDKSKTLRALNDFLGLSLDEQQYIYIINETSFNSKSDSDSHKSVKRKGKSGEWKNYFSDSNKAIFKAHSGELLIKLGYENDYSW